MERANALKHSTPAAILNSGQALPVPLQLVNNNSDVSVISFWPCMGFITINKVKQRYVVH
jgi:hypothetical protein